MVGMSLGCYHRLNHRLSKTQKLGLKHLLQLELKLRHPDYPNAVKGLEGMQVAHEILQEKGLTGILIGGLSEAVWNQKTTEDDLNKHKDVDVMVLDETSSIDKFEGGVDWWLLRQGKITLRFDYTSVEGFDQQWYENGNNAKLSFGARIDYRLNPGLYIPDYEWVINMREAEVVAHVDYNSVNIDVDESVLEKFRKHIKKRVKTKLPPFIKEAFKGHILSPRYEKDRDKVYSVEVVTFDLETLTGINRLDEVVDDNFKGSEE